MKKVFFIVFLCIFYVFAEPFFIMPVKDWVISSQDGFRTNPLGGGSDSFHRGLDIVSKKQYKDINATVYIIAAADGVVEEVYPPAGTPIYGSKTGAVYKGHSIFGGCVLIRHANGYYSLYAHLKNIWVSEGSIVRQGDCIGLMGSTGQSTAQHLHFETGQSQMYLLGMEGTK